MPPPLNFVDYQGRLISQILREPAVEEIVEYEVVKDTPRLVYTDINSSKLAVTEEGELFDMVLRQVFRIKNYQFIQVIDFDNKSMLAMSKTVSKKNSIKYKLVAINDYVNPTSFIDIRIPNSMGVMITTISKGMLRDGVPDEFEGVNKIRTALVTTPLGIYYVSNNDRGYEYTKIPVDNVIDIMVRSLPYCYIIMMITKDGKIRYTREVHTTTPEFGFLDEIEDVHLDHPEKYRFLEFGNLRGLASDNGEISILIGTSELQPIDVPLDCFRIGDRSSKSARNVA